MTCTFVDTAGNAVPPTAGVVPEWTAPDAGQVVKLLPQTDGLSCKAVAVAAGSTLVSVSAPGLTPGTLLIVVASAGPGAAVGLQINFSPAVPVA
jgi:hypothetical protein